MKPSLLPVRICNQNRRAAFDCDTHFPDLDAMDTWEFN